MGILAVLTVLLPLLNEEVPAITSAVKAFAKKDIAGGLKALTPALQKAQPALSAAATSTTPPITINLGAPGTYNITVTIAGK